jgi:hypothetical protein
MTVGMLPDPPPLTEVSSHLGNPIRPFHVDPMDASLPVRLASVYSQEIVNGPGEVSALNGELTDGPTIPDGYPLCRALLRGCTSS